MQRVAVSAQDEASPTKHSPGRSGLRGLARDVELRKLANRHRGGRMDSSGSRTSPTSRYDVLREELISVRKSALALHGSIGVPGTTESPAKAKRVDGPRTNPRCRPAPSNRSEQTVAAALGCDELSRKELDFFTEVVFLPNSTIGRSHVDVSNWTWALTQAVLRRIRTVRNTMPLLSRHASSPATKKSHHPAPFPAGVQLAGTPLLRHGTSRELSLREFGFGVFRWPFRLPPTARPDSRPQDHLRVFASVDAALGQTPLRA